MHSIFRALIVSSALPLLAACTAPAGTPLSSLPADRKEVRAPIESAELLVRESFPPQYAIEIVSGLPNGCAQLSRISVTRERDSIEVDVWNSMPAGDDVVCTMIYGTTHNTAELGSDFESGRAYSVQVNGEQTISFTAQ